MACWPCDVGMAGATSLMRFVPLAHRSRLRSHSSASTDFDGALGKLRRVLYESIVAYLNRNRNEAS
jgi:hypothetical protein